MGTARAAFTITFESILIMDKNTTHGHTAGGRMSPTYQSWTHMKDRCTNPNFNQYHRYGGRGVSFGNPPFFHWRQK